MLVLSPGRELIMTCRGQVVVDGLKVRKGSNTSKRGVSQSAVVSKTEALIQSLKHDVVNDANTANSSCGHTASTSTSVVLPTSGQGLPEAPEVDQETQEKEEGEWNDESGLTQGENSSMQWKWTGGTVGKRDKGAKWSRGATLSLSSVTVSDSGTFTCYHREKERFSIKVIVAGESHTERRSRLLLSR